MTGLFFYFWLYFLGNYAYSQLCFLCKQFDNIQSNLYSFLHTLNRNILKFAVARAVNGRGGIVRPANQERFSSLGLWAEPCEASSPWL